MRTRIKTILTGTPCGGTYRGQVAGYGGPWPAPFEGGQGWVWDGGATQLLPSLGGGGTFVTAMNQRGEDVLGVSGTPLYPTSIYLSDTRPSRGVLWPRH